MHFLVNTVTRGLQQHLIRELYREEHFDQLVREREDVAARRQECTMGLAALREGAHRPRAAACEPDVQGAARVLPEAELRPFSDTFKDATDVLLRWQCVLRHECREDCVD